MNQFDHLFRVAPATAYVAGNDAVAAVTIADGGPRVVNISYSISTADTVIIRVNGVNMPLNNGVGLAANALGTFSFIAHPLDAFIIRFGGNCNINYLVGTMSRG